MSPAARGWSTPTPTHCRITANGQDFDVDPGKEFTKEVNRVASLVGMNGTIYVSLSRAGGPAEFINDPRSAPATTESGMVVKLSPHAQGA